MDAQCGCELFARSSEVTVSTQYWPERESGKGCQGQQGGTLRVHKQHEEDQGECGSTAECSRDLVTRDRTRYSVPSLPHGKFLLGSPVQK